MSYSSFIGADGKGRTVSTSDPLPVDIQGATLNLDAAGVEIANDAGNPIPISDAGGSITVDGPLTDAQLRATAVPVAPNVQQGGGAITASTTRVTLATDGPGVANLASIAGLQIPAHDYIALSYTGTNLTGVVYKTGGSGGTTVATLTLAYSGSNLTSVTKS